MVNLRTRWWYQLLASPAARSWFLAGIGSAVILMTLFGAVATETQSLWEEEPTEVVEIDENDAEIRLVENARVGDTVILDEYPYALARPEPESSAQGSVDAADREPAMGAVQAPEIVIDETPRFDGRRIRPTKTVTMLVTAYSPDWRSCWPSDDGITASGLSVETNGGMMLAADRKYRFGTLMSVPGYNSGKPVPVLDRGAAIKGNRLDVLYPTHGQARKWGRKKLTVTIWEYVE